MTKEKTLIVIGAGIGGLFTGALMAQNGYNVTVLEKNQTIGGGLQCFRRRSKIFETGMHVMGGFEPGGNLSKICKYLGIDKKLQIDHISAECSDQLYFHKQGKKYILKSGKERFITGLSEYFPHEADNIRRYVDKIYEMAEEFPLFNLVERDEGIGMHCEEFIWPADRLIERYVQDATLRELLAYLNPLYGGVKGHSPAYLHALINVLFINGASRFIGGSQQLADALKGVIEEGGGKVLTNKAVDKIDVSGSVIRCVSTADGAEYSAEWYVSAIHPTLLPPMMPPHTFRKSFVNRLDEIPNSYSAFSMYIDLKPGMFKYIPHTCWYMDDYGLMWNQDEMNKDSEPRAFMYMTPPELHQGEYADRLLVHCIMSYEEVRDWENTRSGHRGAEYEKWKSKTADKIIKRLENLYPDFSKMIAHTWTASPLTIRDFYNTKEGAIFGYRKDCEHLLFSHLPVKTRVQNLLMTGQNVNLHGICGVPLTAIYTCEAILGTNHLVRAINNANIL